MLLFLLACSGGTESKPVVKESVPIEDTGPDPAVDDARVRALSGLPQGPNPCGEPFIVRVTDVVDGDTFWSSRDDGGGSVKVRMIGIDTPEISHNGDPADCWANEAWAHSREGLVGKLVWLTFDGECLDYYDRSLAYVFRDNTESGFWNRNLARQGFATVYTFNNNDTYAGDIEDDARAAREEGLGLWSNCPG
jgi:micrococcal nuclease